MEILTINWLLMLEFLRTRQRTEFAQPIAAVLEIFMYSLQAEFQIELELGYLSVVNISIGHAIECLGLPPRVVQIFRQ